jgi:hypothetical protein
MTEVLGGNQTAVSDNITTKIACKLDNYKKGARYCAVYKRILFARGERFDAPGLAGSLGKKHPLHLVPAQRACYFAQR